MRLTFASYNIQRGYGLDLQRDLDRSAKVLAAIQPDVAAIQEVTRADGSAVLDQAAYLGAKLGMSVVRYEVRPHRVGTYGHAVLTRLPVVDSERRDLTVSGKEARGCLRVDLEAGEKVLRVFGCHLGLGIGERRAQVEKLVAFLRDTPVGHRILMGDLNEWFKGPVGRELPLELQGGRYRTLRTHPAPLPVLPLDRIYWDKGMVGSVHVHREGLAPRASDHLPLVATLHV